MTANSTVQDLIRQLQVYFKDLPEVRAAPEYLPNGKLAGPFMVCYPAGFTWTILEDDPQNQFAWMEGKGSVVVELHCDFADLATAYQQAMRFTDLVPNKIIDRYLRDSHWNSTVTLQGTAFPGATGLTINQDRPGPLGWAGEDTWGIRWRIDGLVFRSKVPA